jgi:predicted lipoprotein with Yx(FWY)xxD motif
MRTRLCAATLLLTSLTACGHDSGPEAEEPTSTSRPTDRATDPPTTNEPARSSAPEPVKRGIRIVAADSEFGKMLFGGTGQAIYVFDLETTPKPRCYDTCAEAWPPVLTNGKPVAGLGVESSLLATTGRTDGTVQVTYNDHPLYFYAHEGRREVKCHDVFMNGGNWYVVQPDGDPAPPG